MKPKTFKSLRIGDRVTLAAPRPNYFQRKGIDPVTIPAGSVGIVGAVNVPAVRGPERVFACVDFPDLIVESVSFSGEPLRTVPRVAAFAEELE